MKASDAKALFPTEAALCAAFIAEANALAGWTCHPETDGFDIVLAHDDGRQIGIEAKLKLNAKVADQIMPSDSDILWSSSGPDHRAVLVGCISEANAGIAKMLGLLGVEVWYPRYLHGASYFGLSDILRRDAVVAGTDRYYGVGGHHTTAFYDWNPSQRLQLPDITSGSAAGGPSPIQMTPWKQAAVRVVARLRVQGTITAKEIAKEGCSPSMWTQRWLDRGAVRGQWVESDRMPALDKQHPELYALAIERLSKKEVA